MPGAGTFPLPGGLDRILLSSTFCLSTPRSRAHISPKGQPLMADGTLRLVSAAILVAACSAAHGIEGHLPAAADELLRMYPGSRIERDGDRIRTIYGVPMTPGLNARSAAE